MDLFATGCYRDRIKPDASGALRFAERIVVCDSTASTRWWRFRSDARCIDAHPGAR